jgi:RHS repeat-associated protein
MKAGNTGQTYLYDADGIRVRQSAYLTNTLDYTTYEYFPQYELKVDGTVETATKFYYFGDMRIAQKVGTGALTYLHADHLGSVLVTTGVAGNKRFYPYGATISGSIPTDYGYTGQHNDGTGLLYYKARYYDPASGQFMSADTIVPDPDNVFDYNRYMYGYGNPVKNSDPSGHCAVDANGNENWEGEANFACWTAVYKMLSYSDLPAFRDMFGDGYGLFHLTVVKDASFGADYFNWLAGKLERTLYPQSHYTKVNLHAPAPYEYQHSKVADILIDGPCGVWDCVALGLDTSSLGVSVLQTGATACAAVTGPLCGSAAVALTGADYGIQLASVAHTLTSYGSGDSSAADLSVGLAQVVTAKATFRVVNGSISMVPGAGIAADIVAIGWDLIEPFTPVGRWGAPGRAK